MTDVQTALAERAEGRVPAKGEWAVTGRHLPALNGLRGVAVIGVVAYHLQLGWAKGGYLGVDLFFVLSGFLITTLLLEEWVRSGRVSLAAFWGRRARRLLPALFLVVIALAVYLVLNGLWGGAGANGLVDLSGLRGDAISTLLYVNNWHSIFVHQSYFAQFSTPSPLQHTWSLAIEEQFYLVWPLVLLVLLRYGRRAWRSAGIALAVGLGVLSSVLMAVLFTPGVDPSRVYFGTDTRLFDLMAGATIAFVAAARPQPNVRARRTLHVVAPLAGVALLVFWVTAGYSSGVRAGVPTNFMFEGGFLVCAALAGLVVADARLAEPGGLGRGLAWRPLHFIGTISYGIYLWHWPVIVYLNGARTGLSAWPLDLLRVAATLVLSTASYYLVERPIRLAKFKGWVRYWGAPLAGVLSAVLIVVATFPAVADPATVSHTSRLPAAASKGTGSEAGTGVPGAGGLAGQVPIHLAVAPSPADPLRVMVLGDSVMQDASLGISAALEATGEATVASRTIPGFGLVNASNWRTSLPNLIQQAKPELIVATWSWDQYGPSTPNALHQPAAYTALLKSAVATMLTPGNGVEGVIFTEFPQSGPLIGQNGESQTA
ncbi:MAG TPA: acyltransferase family protein, partial [Acidimicrobiales bacterium]|nr:acyltransferase family protein [Acidimicrobiales bacterium]